MPKTKPQKQHGVDRVAAHLTAERNWLGIKRRHINRPTHQPDQRRVLRIIKAPNLFIAAVNRQRVLHQIVRADAEKIDLLPKGFEHNHRRRNLDHNAKRNRVVERHPLFVELLADIGKNHLRLPELHNRRDQREHDAQLAVGARPQNGAELLAEHSGIAQRKANAPNPHERIALDLIGQRKTGELVGAQVECPNRRDPALHRFDSLFVGFKMDILARQVLRIERQIEEFGAVEANSRRPFFPTNFRLVRELNVAVNLNLNLILRDRRFVGQIVETVGERFVLLYLIFVLLRRLKVRLDN